MDPALIQASQELGVGLADVDVLRRMPFEAAVQKLEELKTRARARYRKLAFKYHPDRNPGDAKAEAMFRALGTVLGEIDKLRVERPPPLPQTVTVVQFYPGATPFGGTIRIQGVTTTTTHYNARRVAYIKFV
jgi:hypothetical protein